MTAKCGVLHTHANTKLIGSSRIEDHVSRCAMNDVYELQQQSQMPAFDCEPLEEVNTKKMNIS